MHKMYFVVKWFEDKKKTLEFNFFLNLTRGRDGN